MNPSILKGSSERLKYAIVIADALHARRLEFRSTHEEALKVFKLITRKVAAFCNERGIELDVSGDGELLAPKSVLPELPEDIVRGKTLKIAIIGGVLMWLLEC